MKQCCNLIVEYIKKKRGKLMAGKECHICGKPSGIYPLCTEHLKLKNEGLVIKNEDGKWIENKEETNGEQTCVICKNSSNGKKLCLECYKETNERKDEFDRNQKVFELKDYYYNLKSNVYRILNFEYVKDNSKKLIAIAYLVNDIYKDTALLDRVFDDVEQIIKTKTPQHEQIITETTEKSDSQKEMLLRTTDGHIVKSKGEVIIDDILYNNMIVHCYEKEVIEIPSTKRTIKSDFFVPVFANRGIYIEYWGMETGEYKKNKEEKKKMYEEHSIELISIEKNDITDKAGLEARLVREIRSLKEKITKDIIK